MAHTGGNVADAGGCGRKRRSVARHEGVASQDTAQHRKFRYGVPAILLLQIVAATLLYVNHCVEMCH